MEGAAKAKIEFNYDDPNSLRALMDEYGDINDMFDGINEHGETILISISRESIVVRTFQKNGWIRLNSYYYDGSQEETFDGRA